MKSGSVIKPFVLSLIVMPIAFAIVLAAGGRATADRFTDSVFAVMVLMEMVILWRATEARKLFSPTDAGHLTWSLIVGFLFVRLLGECRLLTLTFGLVDAKALESATAIRFFYVVALRYLYTLSDVFFIGALINTVRSYKGTGLKFELVSRDYVYIALVWIIPIVTYFNRANLGLASLTGADSYIPVYRLVAVFVGAIIATMCVAIRRYALQMGGGAVSRVWTSVVIAGIARDASFLALALLSSRWPSGAKFAEQWLLWTFAGCWLIAALRQQEVLPRVPAREYAPA
ncbi:MAG TPA: hypothetical protein VKM94_12870 [Blastocatellia bacterium]|nr:hypothetical protein [Blastocatellia bacterium]